MIAPRFPNYEPWAPSNLSSAFLKFAKTSGLRSVRLHDLRHSHATHLLMANYTHVMPGMQDEAVRRVDAALRAAISKRAVP